MTVTSADAITAEPKAVRIGVLVVAYNAATTLRQTLDRIPSGFRDQLDHVLVCDDASVDETYEIGLKYKSGSTLPLTVIKHVENLRYGGNQKFGYRWAIEEGLDIVVLLHGDGQYAPEVMEQIVSPLITGEADVVHGLADDAAWLGPQGRHAALQVRGQPDPHAFPERDDRRRPQRVAQRLPRLPHRRPAGCPLR